MLRPEPRDLVAAAGWAVLLASIILPALYSKASLGEVDLVFLFLGSVFVGTVVADLEKLIIGCVVAIPLSLVIIYVCLNLPVFLGLAVAGEALGSGAIVMIFRSTFPIPVIAILFGGLLGSFFGERFNLR